MSDYVLVESRDVFSTPGVTGTVNMAAELKKQGYTVTLFLVQSSVPEDKTSMFSQRLIDVADSGVTVFADERTLQDRGIEVSNIPNNIKSVSLESVVDHLAAGDIVIWH